MDVEGERKEERGESMPVEVIDKKLFKTAFPHIRKLIR